MIPMIEARRIARLLVKAQMNFHNAHPKHHKKRIRIIKNAMKLNEQLKVVLRKIYPMQGVGDLDNMGWHMVDWMTERVRTTEGRLIQKV